MTNNMSIDLECAIEQNGEPHKFIYTGNFKQTTFVLAAQKTVGSLTFKDSKNCCQLIS